MPPRPWFALFRFIRNLAVAAGLTRFKTPHHIYRFLKRGFKRNEVHLDGHHFYLDSEDSLDLSIDPGYEAFERGIIDPLIAEGDTVLDIGANIGYYTLFFAKLVGPKGKVIAFEPDPDNFSLLQRNVETNRYENVVLHRKAVSERSGMTRLYLSNTNKADHRLYDSGDGRPFVEIETVRLDDYLDPEERIDFIKMDIQGAEPLALAGMKTLLEKNPQAKLFLEFWPAGLKRAGGDPLEFLNLLSKSGFEVYRLDEEIGNRVFVSDPAQLLERVPAWGEGHSNLICFRRQFPLEEMDVRE